MVGATVSTRLIVMPDPDRPVLTELVVDPAKPWLAITVIFIKLLLLKVYAAVRSAVRALETAVNDDPPSSVPIKKDITEDWLPSEN